MADPCAKLLKACEQLLNKGGSLAQANAAQIDYRILRWILQEADDLIHCGRSFVAAEHNCVRRPFESAARIMKKSQRKWHLIFQNCNDFGIGIAEALGMRRPPSLMPPNVWISTLRLLNER